MYCIRCGKENMDSAKFCNECGYDFRTLTGNKINEEGRVTVSGNTKPQTEAPKVEIPKAEPPKAEPSKTEVPKADGFDTEEPPKKKGCLGRIIRVFIIGLVLSFIASGELPDMIDSFRNRSEYASTPTPTPIVLPVLDDRYPTTIEGTADDEFRLCMELLEEDRTTMETGVFVGYEWQALQMFQNANYENEEFGVWVDSYLKLVKEQQSLYTVGSTVKVSDQELADQVQYQKWKTLVFMMERFELLKDTPAAKDHYNKMILVYNQSQPVYEDLKAQFTATPFKWSSERNCYYQTFTNGTKLTYSVALDCTYEIISKSTKTPTYQHVKLNSALVKPGQTFTVDYTGIENNDDDVNVHVNWQLQELYVNGEEIFAYYLANR